jgi:outer membrane protein TolC
MVRTVRLLAVLSILTVFPGAALAEELSLDALIEEALMMNHDVLTERAKAEAASYRPPQERSLPDPMFMFGYQNEGWEGYTYGEMEDSQWMFSLSQMFPFPGKRPLKGKMAESDRAGSEAARDGARQKIVAEVRERFYDLYLAHRSMDLIKGEREFFLKVEETAASRYASGTAPQQEVLMAQAEKYMLDERIEMLAQRLEAAEAMLNLALGREDINAPLGTPEERSATPLDKSLEELIALSYERSPEVMEKQKMVEAAGYGVKAAKREYYPDFTVTASVFARPDPFMDMWSVTTAFNIPLFYAGKQRSAVSEAGAALAGAEHELEGAKKMAASSIRENYAMARTAERLMGLYKDSIIPKSRQGFESALSGYRSGRGELIPVIRSLSLLLDNELLYWGQFVEREKAIARMDSIAGLYPLPGEEGAGEEVER